MFNNVIITYNIDLLFLTYLKSAYLKLLRSYLNTFIENYFS